VNLQKVWLQLPNTELKKDSGLQIKIEVPDDIANAAAADAAVVSK
jgi:hypothetical protein